MKRILEESPVVGYQLFRFQGKRADGTSVVYPKYYLCHAGKTTSTGKVKLTEAKTAVKKMAGEDAQVQKRFNAPLTEVRVGTLLDLVIADYKATGNKTIAQVCGQIKHSLRPYFGDMIAARVDSEEIERWIRWRSPQVPRPRYLSARQCQPRA